MGFKLRSGNGPLKFKQMGATPAKNMKTGSYAHKFEEESKDTPAYLKQFGIGEGTSPTLQVDWSKAPGVGTQERADWYDANNLAHDDTTKVKENNKKEEKVEEPDAEETNVTETGADKIVANTEAPKEKSKLGDKIKKGLATAGKVAFAGFTGGLKEVYGTDAYMPNTVKAYDEDKDKDKDKKTGEDRVDEIINKQS